jgi:hypothetical protein
MILNERDFSNNESAWNSLTGKPSTQWILSVLVPLALAF